MCSVLYSPVTLSLLGPNILLSILFLNTLSLRSFFSASNQVSHPHKTTGKITVLYILIFVFLDSKLEYKRFCTKWQQAFPDFGLLLISSWQPYQFHRDTKLSKNIIQDLPHNLIIGFLKSINSKYIASLCSNFFSSIWQMQNVWSVVDLLCQNPHWWSPIISSAYVINLDSRMLDNILCVVDKSDVPLQSVLYPSYR